METVWVVRKGPSGPRRAIRALGAPLGRLAELGKEACRGSAFRSRARVVRCRGAWIGSSAGAPSLSEGVARLRGMAGLALLLLLALVLGVYAWWQGRPRVEAAALPPSPGSGGIYVHVAGAVKRPGVYRLAAGARAVDAVEAAGGLTPEADPDSLNLARRLSDGDQLYVPKRGESGAAGSSGSGGQVRVSLNRASQEELEKLPGVGPVLAERIVRWRTRHGPFRRWEDLLEVEGVGERKLQSLKEVASLD